MHTVQPLLTLAWSWQRPWRPSALGQRRWRPPAAMQVHISQEQPSAFAVSQASCSIGLGAVTMKLTARCTAGRCYSPHRRTSLGGWGHGHLLHGEHLVYSDVYKASRLSNKTAAWTHLTKHSQKKSVLVDALCRFLAEGQGRRRASSGLLCLVACFGASTCSFI
jgi:hypothetical protein